LLGRISANSKSEAIDLLWDNLDLEEHGWRRKHAANAFKQEEVNHDTVS